MTTNAATHLAKLLADSVVHADPALNALVRNMPLTPAMELAVWRAIAVAYAKGVQDGMAP